MITTAISYIKKSGIAIPICDTQSGGVISADITKQPTITYLLIPDSIWESIIPNKESVIRISGASNTSPKPMTIRVRKETYPWRVMSGSANSFPPIY